MAASVETILREVAARTSERPEAPAWTPGPLPFQPDVFFLGRTEGAGVARDPFDRIVRRCRITTEGAFNALHGSIELEEVFAYDDGELDVWRWAMQPGYDGRYVVAEAKAGVGIEGDRVGEDYLISFRRAVGKARGLFAPRFAARFSQLAPDLVLKQARISLFGAPLGSLTAFHRRV